MDKRPVYPGAIPLDLDWLSPQRNTEIALGFLMQAAFGVSTLVDGLATVPTTVPSMAVKVGPGSIITSTTVDTLGTGFGSLPVDNADPLVKMGVNLTSTTMGVLTAPVTAGFSVNVLVEAQFIEQDSGAVVLPFYNASNPSVPYTGPLNAGTSSNTARTQTVQLQYKYGTAAATGSQVTPSPDAGWIGVSVITIANGQSTVLAANITPYVGAASVTSIGTKLPFVRQRLTANLNLYISPTGSDSNSGLSASVPFATLQKAWNVIISSYDLNGYAVTINCANGTYTSGLAAAGNPVGNTQGVQGVLFVGNAGTPSNCTVNVATGNCFAATNGAQYAISGFKMLAGGAGSSGFGNAILALSGGNVSVVATCEFGTCSNAHLNASLNGSIGTQVSYTISGSALTHWSAASASSIIIGGTGVTLTLTGTPAFTTAFAFAAGASVITCTGLTFSGTATGPKYTSAQAGGINTNGAGVNYLPGSIAGTAGSSGYYV